MARWWCTYCATNGVAMTEKEGLSLLEAHYKTNHKGK